MQNLSSIKFFDMTGDDEQVEQRKMLLSTGIANFVKFRENHEPPCMNKDSPALDRAHIHPHCFTRFDDINWPV